MTDCLSRNVKKAADIDLLKVGNEGIPILTQIYGKNFFFFNLDKGERPTPNAIYKILFEKNSHI